MLRPPRFPDLGMPRADKPPFGGGIVGSAVLHVLLIVLIIWSGGRSQEFFRAAGGPGPEGGGGGGGGSRVTYMELPPLVTASPPAREQPSRQRSVEVPIPRPELKDIPKEKLQVRITPPTGPVVAAVRPGRGAGSGGGEGAGTGSGGGVGTGRGTGIGSGRGPGTGGEGGVGFPPQSRQMLLPPDAPASIKGHEFRVRFWIDEQGRVTRIEVEPRIEDAGYRKKFRERMLQFRFYPARTGDGTPMAAHYDAWITP